MAVYQTVRYRCLAVLVSSYSSSAVSGTSANGLSLSLFVTSPACPTKYDNFRYLPSLKRTTSLPLQHLKTPLKLQIPIDTPR